MEGAFPAFSGRNCVLRQAVSMRSGAPPSDGPRGILALVAPGGTAGRARGNELSKKIYVGNLPWSTTEAELEQMFAEHGSVELRQ